jgi:molybdate transport system ATP-binding protein
MGELGISAGWLHTVNSPELETTVGQERRECGDDGRVLDIRVCKRYAAAGKVTFELDSRLQVQPGVTILLGHSGAGKTTLLRCIAGLAELQTGRIAVGGRALFDSEKRINVEPRERNVAFVFQNLALFPHLSVLANVTYGLRNLKSAEREQRAKAIMQSFRILHLAGRLPGDASGGEQQRVALARALVTEPSVLLLDEPLSSLDVPTKAKIIADLRAWNAARRIPIIYVTHDYAEVLALGERVVTLQDGRVAAQASPLEACAELRSTAYGELDQSTRYFEGTVVSMDESRNTVTCRISTLADLAIDARHGISVGQTITLKVQDRPAKH